MKKKIRTFYSKEIFMTDILSKQNSNLLSAKEESLLNWNEVLEKFKTTFGSDIYESWIKNVGLKKNLTIMLFCLFLPDLCEIG